MFLVVWGGGDVGLGEGLRGGMWGRDFLYVLWYDALENLTVNLSN